MTETHYVWLAQVFDVAAVRAALEQRLKSLELELHQARHTTSLHPPACSLRVLCLHTAPAVVCVLP